MDGVVAAVVHQVMEAVLTLTLRPVLLISVTGHAGGPCEHWVQVWALAKVRDTCSRGSKSRKMVNNTGISFLPATANQAHANPKIKAQFPPQVIFSFSRSPPHVMF